MIIQNPQQLKLFYKTNSRLLGIDVGSKILGLSLTDTRWKIASPYQTLPRIKLSVDATKIQSIIAQFNIAALVVGLPLSMNGSIGSSVQSVRDYSHALAGTLNINILFWDERLTTVMATRTLLAADVSRQRRKQVIDKMAAAIILQGAIDAMHYEPIKHQNN